MDARVPGILLREACAGLLELADKVIVDSQGWAQTREKIQAIRRGSAPPRG